MIELLREALAIILVSLLGLLAYLLFTTPGAQFAARMAGDLVPGLALEGVDGRLWGELRAQRVRYLDDTVDVQVSNATVRVWLPALLSRTVDVSTLHAAHVSIAVASRQKTVETPPFSGRLPVALRARDVQLGELQVVVGAEPVVLHAVALDGEWRGHRLHIAHAAAQTPWVGPLQVQGRAQWTADALSVETLTVKGFAAAQANGVWRHAGESQLDLQWTQLHWPPMPSAPDVAAISSAQGKARWQGTPGAWQWRLDAALDARTLHPQLVGDLRAQGKGTAQALVTESFEFIAHGKDAAKPSAGSLQGRADVAWAPALRVQAQGQLIGVDLSRWQSAVQGEVDANYALTAQWPDGGEAGEPSAEPNVDFRLATTRARLNERPLQASVQGRYADAVLQLAEAQLRAGDSTLAARGQVWPAFDLQLTLDSADLGDWLPALGGHAQAQFAMGGTPQAPRLQGQADGAQLRWQQGERVWRIETLNARIDADLADRADRRDAQMDARIEAQGLDLGRALTQVVLDAKGSLRTHTLTLSVQAPDGEARLAASGGWLADAGRWQGELSRLRIKPAQQPLWQSESPAAVEVSASTQSLEPFCLLSGDARACLALHPQALPGAGTGRRLAFRVEQLALARFAPLLPEGSTLEGMLAGNGYVDWSDAGLGDLRLQLRSTAGRIVRGQLPPLVFGAGQVDVQPEGRDLVLRAALPVADGGLRADLNLAPTAKAGAGFLQRKMRGELVAGLPKLDWLTTLTPEVRDPQGRIDGRLDLAGTLAEPVFSGELTVSDASLRLRTPGIQLEKIGVKLSGSSASDQLALSASAVSDGGELTVDGWLDPFAASMDLNLRGDTVQVMRTPQAKVWVSPALHLAQHGGELRIDGRIDVPRARITPRKLQGTQSASEDQILIYSQQDAPPPRIRTWVDAQLQLGDDVHFKGFGLESRLTGGLHLRDDPGIPTRATGELELVDGKYAAYGQELAIERGRLLFDGGFLIRPAVDIRATRKSSEEITVGVNVRGTLDAPQLSLFSTPSMPQEQQLSWLLLGRSFETASSSASDRELMADAAVGLGLAGGEWLAQKLGKKLGIDEISVGAKAGEASNQAQFTIGKHLSPKLFVSYGISLFQPGHSLNMQYDIGRGFVLSSETGTVSGGDLLYTIEK